jgi:hypothetical protein
LVVTPQPTTVTLNAPASTSFGASTTITATVTPANVTGTVAFYDGATLLASSPVTAGAAKVTKLLAAGSNVLSAQFTPSTATAGVSLSPSLTVKVTPAVTQVALKVGSLSIVKGAAEKLTATVTPAAAAGLVVFYAGSVKLASVKVVKGVATTSTTKLAVGAASLKAVFTPTSSADYGVATSSVVKVTVKS